MPYLRNPVPGQYLHLGWKRDGKDRLYEQVSSLPRRPLWRFFPAFDNDNKLADWIVWMWKTSCYDTSTNGDFLIGWHVNHPSLDGTPKFYRAEQFREQFNKPNVIMPLLTDQNLVRGDQTGAQGNELQRAGTRPGDDSASLSRATRPTAWN